jgi:hypothetical protein
MGPIRFILLLSVALPLLAACAVTTAPTESSTETVDKTTQATSDLTSSTSPGSSSSLAQAEHFTRIHMASIRQDMAVGGGEHLEALAELLGVGEDAYPAFAARARQQYPILFAGAQPEARTVVDGLRPGPKRVLAN